MRTLTNLIAKVLIILISTIGIVSCGEDPEELFQKGMNYAAIRNEVECAKYLKLAAQQGHADAQGYLAVLYFSGSGVEQSYTEGLKWAKLSAEQGSAQGAFALGGFHMNISGDYQEAAKWFKVGAEQGHQSSIEGLELLYKYVNGKNISNNLQNIVLDY